MNTPFPITTYIPWNKPGVPTNKEDVLPHIPTEHIEANKKKILFAYLTPVGVYAQYFNTVTEGIKDLRISNPYAQFKTFCPFIEERRIVTQAPLMQACPIKLDMVVNVNRSC
jgi:hypothetical protein